MFKLAVLGGRGQVLTLIKNISLGLRLCNFRDLIYALTACNTSKRKENLKLHHMTTLSSHLRSQLFTSFFVNCTYTNVLVIGSFWPLWSSEQKKLKNYTAWELSKWWGFTVDICQAHGQKLSVKDRATVVFRFEGLLEANNYFASGQKTPWLQG